jgi:hypothetical protein
METDKSPIFHIDNIIVAVVVLFCFAAMYLLTN